MSENKKCCEKKVRQDKECRREFPGGLVVNDLVVSLLWLRSLRWCSFDPWPGNFCIPQAQLKKKRGGGVKGAYPPGDAKVSEGSNTAKKWGVSPMDIWVQRIPENLLYIYAHDDSPGRCCKT